jgi:hypothetical protein
VSQRPALWSDDSQWWWNGSEWRPAHEFQRSPGTSRGMTPPRRRWYLEVDNSCADSRSVVGIKRLGN